MTAELSSINPNTSLRGVVVSLPNFTPPAGEKLEPVYLPDAISEYGSQCRREGDDPDADCDESQVMLRRIDAQWERDEAVRDQMRTALLCAKNVLTLLSPEVQALGFRASYVPRLIDAAVTADEEGRPSVRAESEFLKSALGVLLVLSRLQKTIAAMGPEEARAVARFADAVKGAQS